MKRAVFSAFAALSLLVPVAGCDKKAEVALAAPPCDHPPCDDAEHFIRRWQDLEKGGAEPAYIESGRHGAGLLGSVHRAVDPPAPTAAATAPGMLNGPLPDVEAARVVRSHLGGVKTCYDIEDRAGRVGSGKAIVNLDIDGATGSVSNIQIEAPAFNRSQLPRCISNQARGWSFPRFSTGPKHFSYPFVFVGG